MMINLSFEENLHNEISASAQEKSKPVNALNSGTQPSLAFLA
jgi:hypothetical protein